MGVNKAEAEEKFEQFLILMDDQIDWLKDEAESHGIALDMTIADCDRLEQLFAALSEGKNRDYLAGLAVTFARYLGEIVRTQYGGNWHLPLDDQKNVNFNTPVIEGHTKIVGLEFAPISIMQAFALRRKAGLLKRAIDAQISPIALDLSSLAAREKN